MPAPHARSTRFPVVVLVVLLSAALALLCPSTALGSAPDPVGLWPLDPTPEVLTGFDPPTSPWGSGHRGVDLLGTPGQPVRAALPGVVRFAGTIAGRGVVVVDHGDTRTTYEPVDATVSVGTPVLAGARIGTLAPAGSHCPPHACLHWGWLRGDTYLDPLRLVGVGPVRLLPLWRAEPLDAGRARAPLWRPPALPYAGWQPLVRLLAPAP